MSHPEITITVADKIPLDRLRAHARRRGLGIAKARGRTRVNNRGGLQVYDATKNTVIAGVDYDLTIDQAAYFVEKAMRERAM
ncbi:hypothetical protein OPKNFCMD_5240 [Methylobacterium crusticola]|uniref:Uncharacterized protein n=1 Tax=Methylobacterium crusticola TaxID=1697972 RepID=A0ABQ4R6P5_9HYPH|nr:hypothetical protein [Methylobacterium crusticola]GJD52474.1 hypothetical protein OPKNFCMD_5240 [Methylobacterium crusticola]